MTLQAIKLWETNNYELQLTNLTSWQVQKQACDNHDPEFYPKYKKWCDEYFLIKVSDTVISFYIQAIVCVHLCSTSHSPCPEGLSIVSPLYCFHLYRMPYPSQTFFV